MQDSATIIQGKVIASTKEGMTIETEAGNTIQIPRDMGSPMKVGSAVKIDVSGGGIEISSADALGVIGASSRYMNFWYPPGAGPQQDNQNVTIKSNGGQSSTASMGSFTPVGFADLPVGSKTLRGSSGSTVFSSYSSAGIAAASDAHAIFRAAGPSEIIATHFTGMFGRTAIVSSFSPDVTIEVDLTSVPSSSVGKYDAMKQQMVENMRENQVSYDEAFEDAAKSDPFIKMFGMAVGEIVASFKWARFMFRGEEKKLQEIFSKMATLDTYGGYCGNCYGKNEIASIEYILVPGSPKGNGASGIPVPTCTGKTTGTVYPMMISVGADLYTVAQMNLVMKDGSLIEYSYDKRSYAITAGTIADKTWISGNSTATYSNGHQIEINNVTLGDITVAGGRPGFCGATYGIPSITWGGDFNFAASGSIYMSATGGSYIHSSGSLVVGGGTKGIHIDDSGSRAITV